jgi:hypothetical protein
LIGSFSRAVAKSSHSRKWQFQPEDRESSNREKQEIRKRSNGTNWKVSHENSGKKLAGKNLRENSEEKNRQQKIAEKIFAKIRTVGASVRDGSQRGGGLAEAC